MNILFLLRLWPVYGGGESVTRILANELVNRGHQVHIAYFQYTDYGTTPVVDSMVMQHQIKNVCCDQYTSNFVEDHSNVSGELCTLINEHRIDIVINQWHPYAYIRDIKRKTSAKVIWCLHTIFIQPFEKPKEFIRWMKYTIFPHHYIIRNQQEAVYKVDSALPYVDKYVFLSKEYQKEYLMYGNIDNKDKLLSIPNPISINDDMDIDHKENTIIVVGRMQEVTKKYSNVLKVWKKIESKAKGSLNWHLKFVGDGESLDDYKNWAKKYNLKNITFEGFQRPAPYYSQAKIFLMTSRIEGFPMAIIEAQKYGAVPVVMESFPAVHDIINNYENGILTPKDDINSMANALWMLMHDDTLLNRLKINGIKSSRNFSVEKVVDIWENLFNTLLS